MTIFRRSEGESLSSFQLFRGQKLNSKESESREKLRNETHFVACCVRLFLLATFSTQKEDENAFDKRLSEQKLRCFMR